MRELGPWITFQRVDLSQIQLHTSESIEADKLCLRCSNKYTTSWHWSYPLSTVARHRIIVRLKSYPICTAEKSLFYTWAHLSYERNGEQSNQRYIWGDEEITCVAYKTQFIAPVSYGARTVAQTGHFHPRPLYFAKRIKILFHFFRFFSEVWPTIKSFNPLKQLTISYSFTPLLPLQNIRY